MRKRLNLHKLTLWAFFFNFRGLQIPSQQNILQRFRNCQHKMSYQLCIVSHNETKQDSH